MKSKQKAKIIIAVLGIVFAMSAISNYNFSDDQDNNNDGGVEIQDDISLKRPRKSGTYTESFIHIDGNWSDADGKGWFSGDGSFGNPYVIENVTIDATGSPTGCGIFINNSKNDYFIINKCTVYNAGSTWDDAGIKLENTNNGTLTNNNCSNNNWVGICIKNDCDNNTISGNAANENINYGIYIRIDCNNNTVSGNIVNKNNLQGIRVANNCNNNTISGNLVNKNSNGIRVTNNCNNNTISGNLVNDNFGSGISMYTSCDSNTIVGNTIICDVWELLKIDNCDDNTIVGNFLVSFYTIPGSEYIQVGLSGSGNLIYYNHFANPIALSDQGHSSSGNQWFKGLIGNYWNWYHGGDDDGDGIGDTPKWLGSVADEKPIMNYKPFFTKSPEDLSYEAGTTGHTLKWTVWDVSPCILSYTILRDGSPIKSDMNIGEWTLEIEIPVDGLTEGTYGFTLEVDDVAGYTNSDSVWVTVTNTRPLFTAKPDDISYKVGQMGNNLSWTFSDMSTNNPSYTITRNGVPIIVDEPCVSGEYIIISVDGLDVGTHGFTIEVNDGYGGTVMDSVWVMVTSNSNSNSNSVIIIEEDNNDDDNDGEEEIDILGPTLIIIGTTSAVGIAGVAIYLLRKKRLNLKRE
ncbi:MAG: NosD domain-containing protein [Promethearchaeota archaeon]